MRRHFGAFALVAALVMAALMAAAAAPGSGTRSDAISDLALVVARGFGVVCVLAVIGLFARASRPEAAQALAIAVFGGAAALAWSAASQFAMMGRPWRDRLGQARRAGGLWRDDWAGNESIPSAEKRGATAERWLRAALDEHASIAAFSQLALDLLAHGSPPELLRACHEAALDEVRHAERCFARASALDGRSHGPSALPIPRATTPSLAALARTSYLDGCVGEGTAARCAELSTQAAADAGARQIWREIAEDEARHAELGWRVLEWALAQDPSGVGRALTRLPPPWEPTDEAPLSSADASDGWLDAETQRRASSQVSARARARLSELLDLARAA